MSVSNPTTTTRIPAPTREPAAAAAERIRAQAASAVLAGLLIFAAGAVVLMGIITGEAFYPDVYTTHDHEISDLGATRPPDSIIHQPSATIFNVVMMFTGVAVLAAAPLLHRAYHVRRVTIFVALLGLGALGVGVFPGNMAPMHGIFALLTFAAGGVAAILAANVLEGPFRHVSRALGVVALGSLVVAFAGESTVFYEELGAGGLERWVAYPIIIWLIAFGAYQMAATEHRAVDRPQPPGG